MNKPISLAKPTLKKQFHSCWVGDLPKDASKEQILDAFKVYGKITKVDIKPGKEDKLFAFVNFETQDEAKLAGLNPKNVQVNSSVVSTNYKPLKITTDTEKVEKGQHIKKELNDKDEIRFVKKVSQKPLSENPEDVLVKKMEKMEINKPTWTAKSYIATILKDCDAKLYKAASVLPTMKLDGNLFVLVGFEEEHIVILGGKVEDSDNGDSMMTAAREFDEESGLIYPRQKVYEKIKANKKVCWIASGKLALYFLENELDVDFPIRHLKSDKKHEIASLHWIDFEVIHNAAKTGEPVKLMNREMNLTNFTRNVIRTVANFKAIQ